MSLEDDPWKRVKGTGTYPVEYAGWLLNPIRHLIAPPDKIVRRLQLKPADHVLEIGCGPGFFSPHVACKLLPYNGPGAGRLTLFDAQPGMIQIALQRLRMRHIVDFDAVAGSAEALPFRSGAFDVAFMVTVLGEVTDRVAAMHEVVRVLRPGGKFSVTEAAGDPDRLRQSEVDALASQVGLEKEGYWGGMFVKTFNYRKAVSAD